MMVDRGFAPLVFVFVCPGLVDRLTVRSRVEYYLISLDECCENSLAVELSKDGQANESLA